VPDELLSVAAQRLIEMHASHGEADELLEVLRKAADQLDDLSVLSDALATIPRQVGLVDRVVERAKQADTTSGRQAMALAQLLLTAKRYEQAGEFFQAAIATDAEQAADFSLTWGLALFAADQFDAAATVFQQALDAKLLDSDDPMFHYYLSMSLEMAGQTDEALRVARAAAEMQPDSAEFAAHIPWILYHADRREEAIAAYEAVIAKFDDQFDSETRLQLRDARSSLSHMATINGDLAAGEEWLAQVLDEFPEDIGAQNDLGYLWADSGKHVSRARAMIQQAVDAEPDNAAYRDSLGWVLFQQGEADAAIRELETAVELSRGADGQIDEADGVILDHLGDAHLRAGNVDHALRYWQLALRDLEKNEPQRADVTRKKIQQHSKE
jgi:tetratricopeptide (TPR) repeat protein